MITVREAHDLIAGSVTGTAESTSVALQALTGRILAEDIRAGFPMPRFTNAAMDGFAVRYDEIRSATPETPVILRVSQELAAGALSTMPLAAGTCSRIMTGAPLPAGADTVIPFEQTSGFESDVVEFYKTAAKGANIRLEGEEVQPGTLLAAAGTRITPADIAILATFGVGSALVRPQPKVTLITVGDELRIPGETLEPLSICNSNLPMLRATVEATGAVVLRSLQLRDDRRSIHQALAEALTDSDMLITAGGISTGRYDYMHDELDALGVEQKFWKVAQKPGKPLYFGTRSGTLVFSLPGNPVSALVCFLEYCMPALARLQGVPETRKVNALLDGPFPADSKRHRFLFGHLRVKEGKLFCRISAQTESHMLTALSGANCVIESPPLPASIPAGTMVSCSLLPWIQSL